MSARWEGAVVVSADPQLQHVVLRAEWAGTRVFVPPLVLREAGIEVLREGDRVAVVTSSADRGLCAEAIKVLSRAPAEAPIDA